MTEIDPEALRKAFADLRTRVESLEADSEFVRKAVAQIATGLREMQSSLDRCRALEAALELHKIGEGRVWTMLGEITERIANGRK